MNQGEYYMPHLRRKIKPRRLQEPLLFTVCERHLRIQVCLVVSCFLQQAQPPVDLLYIALCAARFQTEPHVLKDVLISEPPLSKRVSRWRQTNCHPRSMWHDFVLGSNWCVFFLANVCCQRYWHVASLWPCWFATWRK